MWRYLKAAFLVGVDVKGLGRLPVNLLGVAAVGIFGIVEPSVWLAGLGLEAAFVASLAFSPRFQKLTDGQESLRGLADEVSQRNTLIATLPTDLQNRLVSVRRNAARVLEIYQSLGFDEAATQHTRSSLERLEWIYLKLLVARHHVATELGPASLPELTSRIAQLEAQTAHPDGQPDALVRSQEATLSLLRKRAENLKSQKRLLAENESDLERIESQISLMRENAAIEGKPASVEMEIDLASDLASPEIFGAQSGLIERLEYRRG
jgi:chromosome segregation ATPase